MPRTPTLENPFAPEKHRSADDPKFVGKILGAEAEKAMRKVTGVSGEKRAKSNDFDVTPEEQAKIAEDEKRKGMIRERRKELLAWAEEFGFDVDWAKETFAVRFDGSIIVAGDLSLAHHDKVTHLPKGLVEVQGDLNLEGTNIMDCGSLPKSIKGSLILKNVNLYFHSDLLQTITIGRNLFLGNTALQSPHDLPPPENIGGFIFLDSSNQWLADMIRQRSNKYHISI